jgi:hypothetical protein
VAAAGPLVARLDVEALATRRPVTIPLVRKVLGETGEPCDRSRSGSSGC